MTYTLRNRICQFFFDLALFIDKEYFWDIATDYAIDYGYGYCEGCEPEPRDCR